LLQHVLCEVVPEALLPLFERISDYVLSPSPGGTLGGNYVPWHTASTPLSRGTRNYGALCISWQS
jgi:hypothetical protein